MRAFNFIKKRLNNKEYMQNILVEAVGDIVMLVLGLLIGYYIKRYVFGF